MAQYEGLECCSNFRIYGPYTSMVITFLIAMETGPWVCTAEQAFSELALVRKNSNCRSQEGPRPPPSGPERDRG